MEAYPGSATGAPPRRRTAPHRGRAAGGAGARLFVDDAPLSMERGPARTSNPRPDVDARARGGFDAASRALRGALDERARRVRTSAASTSTRPSSRLPTLGRDRRAARRYGRKKHPAAPGLSSGHSDWQCDRCNAVNFARRARCYQCAEEKPPRAPGAPPAPAPRAPRRRGRLPRHPRIVGEGMGTSLLTPAPVRGDVDGRYDSREPSVTLARRRRRAPPRRADAARAGALRAEQVQRRGRDRGGHARLRARQGRAAHARRHRPGAARASRRDFAARASAVASTRVRGRSAERSPRGDGSSSNRPRRRRRDRARAFRSSAHRSASAQARRGASASRVAPRRGPRSAPDARGRPQVTFFSLEASTHVFRASRGRVTIDGVASRRAACESNLQLDFTVSVFECFDTSAVLREPDESNRSVQNSAESTWI